MKKKVISGLVVFIIILSVFLLAKIILFSEAIPQTHAQVGNINTNTDPVGDGGIIKDGGTKDGGPVVYLVYPEQESTMWGQRNFQINIVPNDIANYVYVRVYKTFLAESTVDGSMNPESCTHSDSMLPGNICWDGYIREVTINELGCRFDFVNSDYGYWIGWCDTLELENTDPDDDFDIVYFQIQALDVMGNGIGLAGGGYNEANNDPDLNPLFGPFDIDNQYVFGMAGSNSPISGSVNWEAYFSGDAFSADISLISNYSTTEPVRLIALDKVDGGEMSSYWELDDWDSTSIDNGSYTANLNFSSLFGRPRSQVSQMTLEISNENRGCDPYWVCGDWSDCTTSGAQTRICEDTDCNQTSITEAQECTPPGGEDTTPPPTNTCGNADGVCPAGCSADVDVDCGGASPSQTSCTLNWVCEEWSECTTSNERTCNTVVDSNVCPEDSAIVPPSMTEECQYGSTTCDPNWICAEWSACTSDSIRTCQLITDSYNCDSGQEPEPMIKECEFVSSSTEPIITMDNSNDGDSFPAQVVLSATVEGAIDSLEFYRDVINGETTATIGVFIEVGTRNNTYPETWEAVWNSTNTSNGTYYIYAIGYANDIQYVSRNKIKIIIDHGQPMQEGVLAEEDVEEGVLAEEEEIITGESNSYKTIIRPGGEVIKIVLEEPIDKGILTPEKLKVKKVENFSPVIGQNQIIFSGIGPPNTYVTLYIYSSPIVVTTKTDASGNFIYILDKDLLDGEHEVYVTITDETGKIKEKSSPLTFFVRRAQAVTEGEYLRGDVNVQTESQQTVNNYLVIVIVIVGGVLIILLVAYLVSRRRQNE